jgi:hypothetical protein
MDNLAEFDRYIEHLCVALEHQDRNTGLQDYCREADAADPSQEY